MVQSTTLVAYVGLGGIFPVPLKAPVPSGCGRWLICDSAEDLFSLRGRVLIIIIHLLGLGGWVLILESGLITGVNNWNSRGYEDNQVLPALFRRTSGSYQGDYYTSENHEVLQGVKDPRGRVEMIATRKCGLRCSQPPLSGLTK
jgi:hypothetical protein